MLVFNDSMVSTEQTTTIANVNSVTTGASVYIYFKWH